MGKAPFIPPKNAMAIADSVARGEILPMTEALTEKEFNEINRKTRFDSASTAKLAEEYATTEREINAALFAKNYDQYLRQRQK